MVECPNCHNKVNNIIEQEKRWEVQLVSLDIDGELKWDYQDTLDCDELETIYSCPECDFQFNKNNPDFNVKEFLEDDELKKILIERKKNG